MEGHEWELLEATPHQLEGCVREVAWRMVIPSMQRHRRHSLERIEEMETSRTAIGDERQQMRSAASVHSAFCPICGEPKRTATELIQHVTAVGRLGQRSTRTSRTHHSPELRAVVG